MRDADAIGDAESVGKTAYEITQQKSHQEIEDAKYITAEKNRRLMEIVTALNSTKQKIVHSQDNDTSKLKR